VDRYVDRFVVIAAVGIRMRRVYIRQRVHLQMCLYIANLLESEKFAHYARGKSHRAAFTLVQNNLNEFNGS
jgi:hypothetical protein